MGSRFEIAGGTTAGRDHRTSGKNNHDAYHYRVEGNLLVGVVCDGCGSSKHSEVGAKIGARLVVQAIVRQLRRLEETQYRPLTEEVQPLPSFWESVRQEVLTELRALAGRMGDSLSAVVNDYFLFTTIGAIVTRYGASFFSLGDGVIIVNG